MMTLKQMCEIIAKHWKTHHDLEVDPKDIFEYSPTGELFNVFAWYNEAVTHSPVAQSG